MKMSTMKKAVVAAVGVMAFSSAHAAINWTLSPDADTLAFANTVVVGANEINFLDNGTQPAGVFGAGFTINGPQSVGFDYDLSTWDSYNAPGTNGPAGGDGYFDAFIVSISSTGFYWDIIVQPNDPVLANASTFVWGGTSWNDGILDQTGVQDASVSSAAGGKLYVSFVLDTFSSPDSDTLHPSYGSFHVSPVPEPEIYAMLAAGMGLMGFIARRRKKFDDAVV